MADTTEILFGTPNQRPSPLKLRGKLFIDFMTPAGYLSLGDKGGWVNFTGGSGTGNIDGGDANSVYILNQVLSGGGA